MPKKGKKKHRTQEEAPSTSSTGPTTSGQQSSQQKQTPQTSKLEEQDTQQRQKQQKQQQQQQQLPEHQQQPQQPRKWGPPRPQQAAPRQISEPGSLSHPQQIPIQQFPSPQQVPQPQTWGSPRSGQLTTPQQQQFRLQQANQPPVQPSTQHQTFPQYVQQQPQVQPPPQLQQMQPMWVRPSQIPSQQSQPVQSAWVRPPQAPSQQSQPVQSAWARPPQAQQVPPQQSQQVPPQQSAWIRPLQVAQPPQQVPQVPLQQPLSYPSTSGRQAAGAGDDGLKGKVTSPTSVTEKLSKVAIWETKSKSNMTEKDLNIPRRPNPLKAGNVGQRVIVLTNMFEIVFKPNFVDKAVHYDVKVVPTDTTKRLPKKDESTVKLEVKNKVLLRKIFEQFRSENFRDRYPAFDGKANAFTANDLPFSNTFVKEINFYDEEKEEHRTFEVTLNKAGIVDLSWIKHMRPGIDETVINKTAIQVLDIILRHAPSSRLINVGRSLFPPGDNRRVKALGSGLDLHVGGYLSAVIGWKPYLNIDVSHKAFATSQTILALMCELCNLVNNQINVRAVYDNINKISKFLAGLKVNYAIPGQPSTKRTFRVNELGPDATQYKFEVNGKMYTIQEYYANIKNYKIIWPNLPCLWVGKRDGKTYLPAELCSIVAGQAINRKLDESQTTQMIRYAATDTDERKTKIITACRGINVNNSPVMQKEFLLSISTEMKEVEARILPPPELLYDRASVQVRKGVWRAKRFNTPAMLEDNTWTIVNTCPQNMDNKIPDFVQILQDQANIVGMRIGKPQLPYLKVRPVPFEIEKLFMEKKNLKLIFVILPNHTDAVYGKVKKISELRVGVLTQCVKIKNVYSTNSSTAHNILLKVNSKLNGINHTFTSRTMPYCLRDTNYMLIGADVSHPSPDAKDIPSVAAVAASHDETTFKYNVTIRLQQAKQEEIADLKEIMLKHIVFYVNEMKRVPKRIFFYRDGVSEGQIAMVLDKEIRSIKEACIEYARTRRDFKPELTFVIVQKRHHVRIFPKNPNETDDRNKNVRAGTIVDTEITHPNHIDFYLVSHASIQGTARPTKYRCICNESNFNENQLEELTYHLCHMYARCTRSVSYPAPTYYAHLAAYRGRMWIQGDRYTDNDFQDKAKCKLEPILQLPMSFV
ncbi:protein argonaute-2 isoform X2 [Harpegnathos saltator]|uniref:protein argonaute-2 isoform X2 n=1 Tax=Harpegnathos saltator TaxID=610380 RepID=UPI00058E6F89|nr:protein argonaute-2 isoform X2 [Harpegnathos saltator]